MNIDAPCNLINNPDKVLPHFELQFAAAPRLTIYRDHLITSALWLDSLQLDVNLRLINDDFGLIADFAINVACLNVTKSS